MIQTAIRLRKGIHRSGIVCLMFFSGIGIASVVGILFDPPPNAGIPPGYLALAFGCFWGAMACLALRMVLAYWRERVIVTGESVTWQGVLQSATIRFDEIERVIWQPAPSRIRLHAGTSRVIIELSNFEVADRLGLIRHFQRLPESAHEGWEMFCVRVAVPLLEGERRGGQDLGPDKSALTRTRWAWYFVPTTILFAIVGITLAWTLHKPRMLAAPLPLLALWAYLHFSTPPQGLATTRIRAESGSGGFLRFLLIWCGIGLAGSFLLTAFGLPLRQIIAWGVGGGAVWLFVLMYKAFRLDRQRRHREEKRIPAALKEWGGGRALPPGEPG